LVFKKEVLAPFSLKQGRAYKFLKFFGIFSFLTKKRKKKCFTHKKGKKSREQKKEHEFLKQP